PVEAISANSPAPAPAAMASTGERLVKWSREFTPNPAHRELYDGMMQKWQAVYADQLGLVDSGLTTSMWQAPGLMRDTRPSP
ncbi:autoinducer-2 kinase, partial (plasmid) [Enterobacter hormaechei]